jgi:hypothetical protein
MSFARRRFVASAAASPLASAASSLRPDRPSNGSLMPAVRGTGVPSLKFVAYVGPALPGCRRLWPGAYQQTTRGIVCPSR